MSRIRIFVSLAERRKVTTWRRILLGPFALLYGLALRGRHAAYDLGLLRRHRPELPAIVVGNLALGGTGKTPHVELVLRMLMDMGALASLSRGYGRRGTDIHEVQATDTAERSGDEPVQLKRRMPEVRVFVGADRVKAIARIQRSVPDARAVVLDDAFQHRRLNAHLNVLLTRWDLPWSDDALIPAGSLRDLPARARNAQAVVVTKCMERPTPEEERQWRIRLGLRSDQLLCFSDIVYESPRAAGRELAESALREASCLLFTGIADPGPLVAHLGKLFARVEHMAFPDHHAFSAGELKGLARRYANFAAGPKWLVTTEKDAARLDFAEVDGPLQGLPLATIGIRARILNETEHLEHLVRDLVGTYPADR